MRLLTVLFLGLAACTSTVDSGSSEDGVEGAISAVSFTITGKPCRFESSPDTCALETRSADGRATGTVAVIDYKDGARPNFDVKLSGAADAFVIFGKKADGSATADLEDCLGHPGRIYAKQQGSKIFTVSPGKPDRLRDLSTCGVGELTGLYFAALPKGSRVTATATGSVVFESSQPLVDTSCLGIVACLGSCANGDLDTCKASCEAMASVDAAAAFEAVYGYGQKACPMQPHVDGTDDAACTTGSDNLMLTPEACGACLTAAKHSSEYAALLATCQQAK